MSKLLRLYLTHTAIGYGISAVFTAAVLWGNVANLGVLMTKDPMGWLAIAVFWFFHGSLFGAVQFGIRVMAMAEKPNDTPSDTPRRGPMIPAYATQWASKSKQGLLKR